MMQDRNSQGEEDGGIVQSSSEAEATMLDQKVQPLPTMTTTQEEYAHEIDVDAMIESGPLEEKPEQKQDDKKTPSEPSFATLQERLENRIPRIYFVTVQLILPLFALIGLSFLFGYLLALFEMPNEIEANDTVLRQALLDYSSYTQTRRDIYARVGAISAQCLEQVAIWNTTSNLLQRALENITTTNTYTQYQNCATEGAKEEFDQQELIPFLLNSTSASDLSFNWMICNTISQQNETYLQELGLNAESSYDQQSLIYINALAQQFFSEAERAGYRSQQLFTNETLFHQFLDMASGGGGCQVHTAGGALFWFTIMTTIGYGNTAPVTVSGRALVFTGGFITIIAFLALNNTASTVWKLMFEDFFLRHKMPYLIQGPICCFFWLCMTILWMLILALSVKSYNNHRLGGSAAADFPLSESFWFSYITTTTVGFGDIYLSHEEFKTVDMFFIPMMVLLGFNFLGIFASKMIDLYNHYFPERGGFAAILERKRQEDLMRETS